MVYDEQKLMKKIKAVIDASQELTNIRFDKLSQKVDHLELIVIETNDKVDQIKDMLTEDITAVNHDITVLDNRVTRLEQTVMKV